MPRAATSQSIVLHCFFCSFSTWPDIFCEAKVIVRTQIKGLGSVPSQPENTAMFRK